MNENEMHQIAEKWRKFATTLAVMASILVFIAGIVSSRDPFSGEFLFLPFLLFCLLAGVGIAAWYGLWEIITALLDGVATMTGLASRPTKARPAPPAPSVSSEPIVRRAREREEAVLRSATEDATEEAAEDGNAELLQRIQSLEMQLAASQRPLPPEPPTLEPALPGAPTPPPADEPSGAPLAARAAVERAVLPGADRVAETDSMDRASAKTVPGDTVLVEASEGDDAPVHEMAPRQGAPDTEASDGVPTSEAALPTAASPRSRPTCGSCGAENPAGFAFCTSCGTPAPV